MKSQIDRTWSLIGRNRRVKETLGVMIWAMWVDTEDKQHKGNAGIGER